MLDIGSLLGGGGGGGSSTTKNSAGNTTSTRTNAPDLTTNLVFLFGKDLTASPNNVSSVIPQGTIPSTTTGSTATMSGFVDWIKKNPLTASVVAGVLLLATIYMLKR